MSEPSGAGPTYFAGSAAPCAEAVPAGDQRDSFFVVHRHAAEGLADILGRCEGIRVTVRAFRIVGPLP
jgi:hypothetical protein